MTLSSRQFTTPAVATLALSAFLSVSLFSHFAFAQSPRIAQSITNTLDTEAPLIRVRCVKRIEAKCEKVCSDFYNKKGEPQTIPGCIRRCDRTNNCD